MLHRFQISDNFVNIILHDSEGIQADVLCEADSIVKEGQYCSRERNISPHCVIQGIAIIELFMTLPHYKSCSYWLSIQADIARLTDQSDHNTPLIQGC